MRPILVFLCVLPLFAQRTATVCGADANPASCSPIETSKIGNLRFEDYRVTNPNAPLVNLDVRRAHLAQITLPTRNLLCTANLNATAILTAPAIRFSSASADMSELESLPPTGLLNQEVFAQTTVFNMVLSDGFSIPQFVFRLSRSRGSAQIVLTLNPAYLPSGVAIAEYTTPYVLAVDPSTSRVTFLSELPTNSQLLRIFWTIAVNLPSILNENASYRIPDPTPFNRPLFTAQELRGLAGTFSKAILDYASPTFAPVLDASCTKSPSNSCSAQDDLQRFGDTLARNGSEYLATGSLTPALILNKNLAAWARANALATSTDQNLMSILQPIALFWPSLERDAAIPAEDRNAIGTWLRPVYQAAVNSLSLPDRRGTQAAAIRIMDAIQRRDDLAFAQSVERYWIAIHQLRADGSMPLEAQRGPCALSYTNQAISHLVSIAESAAAQGYDLYSLNASDRSLSTAIQYFLDAYDNTALIAKYNNPGAECEFGNNAPLERKALEINANSSAPAAWIEIYLARFPNSPLANRLRARAGLTGLAKRPLFHYSVAANTSCLFLAPQELNPVSLPNLDVVSGNNQTGPTKALLPDQLGVRVRGNSGNPLPNVLVNFTLGTGAASIEPSSALTDPFGIAYAKLTLGPRSGPIEITVSALGLPPLKIAAFARGDDPKLSPGGVVGVGGSVPSVRNASPGAILSLYGADFVLPGQGGRATLQDNRLPTMLTGICVYFGTTPAYMLDAYPNQLNIVVPALTGSTAELRVAKNCGSPIEERTDPQTISIASAAPEFFFFDATSTGNNPVAAVDAITNEYFGPLTLFGGSAKPARPGDFVTLYLTGLGATNPPVAPGALASGLSALALPFELRLAGQVIPMSNILYAGFAPGSLIYQINFRIPTGLPASNQPISVRVDGQTTPPGAYLTLALR